MHNSVVPRNPATASSLNWRNSVEPRIGDDVVETAKHVQQHAVRNPAKE